MYKQDRNNSWIFKLAGQKMTVEGSLDSSKLENLFEEYASKDIDPSGSAEHWIPQKIKLWLMSTKSLSESDANQAMGYFIDSASGKNK